MHGFKTLKTLVYHPDERSACAYKGQGKHMWNGNLTRNFRIWNVGDYPL